MPDPSSNSPVWQDDLLKNPHAVADKRSRVQKMFAAIAPSYDLNNRLHSLWMDQSWRKRAVKLAELNATDVVVDVACGTGDLSIAFVRELWWQMIAKSDAEHKAGVRYQDMTWVQDAVRVAQVIGIDFTYEMLPIARKKGRTAIPGANSRIVNWCVRRCMGREHGEAAIRDMQHRNENVVSFLNADALCLPLADACANVVSIAFGIRNVQDPGRAIGEFYRILRPGGRVIILEFSLPTNPVLRGLYNFYFRKVLPRTATLISGDKTGAYKYLPESVNTFIGREQMMEMMRQAGFQRIEQFPMTFGVCVCYRGIKE